MIRYLLILLTLTPMMSELAFAEVSIVVSEDYRTIQYESATDLKPGAYLSFDLHLNKFGDEYAVQTTVNSPGVELLVLDGRDRDTDNPNPIPILKKPVLGEQLTMLAKPPSESGLLGILINRSSRNIHATAIVTRIGKRPKEVTNQIRQFVAIPFETLDKVYKLPQLSVTVAPCGTTNAFSTPNIYICTELMADLSEKGVPKAVYPILLHELAHSILYLWELPGYDNEDIADEFAAMLLAKSSPEVLAEYVSWLNQQDPVSEAVAQLAAGGDSHSLSIQRAKNMQRILDNPEPVMYRWDKLLAEHVRIKTP